MISAYSSSLSIAVLERFTMSEETQKILFDAAGKPTHVDGLLLRDSEAENIENHIAADPAVVAQLSASMLLRQRATDDLRAVYEGGRKIEELTAVLGKSPASEAKDILAALHALHGKSIVRSNQTIKECALYGVDVLTDRAPVLQRGVLIAPPLANPLEKFKAEIEQFVEQVRPMVDDLKATFDESNQMESLFNCLRSLEVVRRLRSADLDPAESKKTDAKDSKDDTDPSHDHIDLAVLDCFLQNEANRLVDAMLPEDEPEVPTETKATDDTASEPDPTIESDPTAEA